MGVNFVLPPAVSVWVLKNGSSKNFEAKILKSLDIPMLASFIGTRNRGVQAYLSVPIRLCSQAFVVMNNCVLSSMRASSIKKSGLVSITS